MFSGRLFRQALVTVMALMWRLRLGVTGTPGSRIPAGATQIVDLRNRRNHRLNPIPFFMEMQCLHPRLPLICSSLTYR